MNLESVTYRRLYNLGNYENEVFEATAVVNHQDPGELLIQLQAWADDEHILANRRRGRVEAENRAFADRERDLKRIEEDIDRMRNEWVDAKAFLVRMGIKLPYLFAQKGVSDDDVPF